MTSSERPAFRLSTKVDHKRYYDQQTYPSPFLSSTPTGTGATSATPATNFSSPKQTFTNNSNVYSSSSVSSLVNSSNNLTSSKMYSPADRSSSTSRAVIQSPPNHPPTKKQRATSTPRTVHGVGSASRRPTGIPSMNDGSGGIGIGSALGANNGGLGATINRPFQPSHNIRVGTNANASSISASNGVFATKSHSNTNSPIRGVNAETSSKTNFTNISPNMANDAIAHRRAELRRLQMEQSSQNQVGQALIDRARRLTGNSSSLRTSNIGGINGTSSALKSSVASSTLSAPSRITKLTTPATSSSSSATSPAPQPPPPLTSISSSASSTVSVDKEPYTSYTTRTRPVGVTSSPKLKVTNDGTTSNSAKDNNPPQLSSAIRSPPTKDLTSQPDPISTPPSTSPSQPPRAQATSISAPSTSYVAKSNLNNISRPEPIHTRQPSITTTLSTSSPPHPSNSTAHTSSPKKGTAHPPLPSFITTTNTATSGDTVTNDNSEMHRNGRQTSQSGIMSPPTTDKTESKPLSSKRQTLMELRSAAETPPPKEIYKAQQSSTSATTAKPFVSPTPNLLSKIDKSSKDTSMVVTKDDDVMNEVTTMVETKEKSSELRLLKQLVETNKEKKGLAEKVSQLEQEVTQYRLQKVTSDREYSTPSKDHYNGGKHTATKEESLNQLLDICRSKGKNAALEWAKQNMKVENGQVASPSQQPLPRLVQDDDDVSVQHFSDRKKRGDMGSYRGGIDSIRGGDENGGIGSSFSFDGSHRGRTTVAKPPTYRVKSPVPTQRRFQQSQSPLADNQIASRAVETVEDMYCSDMARFYVRKPYGGNETMVCSMKEPESNGANQKRRDSTKSENQIITAISPCKVEWVEPVESYLKNATVHDEKSLEVMAKIGADESVLILYGTCNVKHGMVKLGDDGSIIGYDWMTMENVENTDEPLGRVMYIDVDGNDGEYWLDTIYEEALKIRESYSSNVFSAAMAIKVTASEQGQKGKELFANTEGVNNFQTGISVQPTPGMPNSPMLGIAAKSVVKHETADACVGTEDLPITKQQEPFSGTSPKSIPKPVSKPSEPENSSAPEEAFEDSGSTDALSRFIIFFFSTIFNFIWFIFISLPFKMVWWSILSLLICTTLSLVWLFLSDDNGAKALGAGIDFGFNSPSLFNN